MGSLPISCKLEYTAGRWCRWRACHASNAKYALRSPITPLSEKSDFHCPTFSRPTFPCYLQEHFPKELWQFPHRNFGNFPKGTLAIFPQELWQFCAVANNLPRAVANNLGPAQKKARKPGQEKTTKPYDAPKDFDA